MATVKESLIAAKALIDTPKKWGKGHGASPPSQGLCALGACGAEGGHLTTEAIEEALPADWQHRQVFEFNDHPSTTHADIMALFDRAIAAQDGA